MFRIFSTSMMGKLVGCFVAVVLIAIVLVGYLAHRGARSALYSQACRDVENAREVRKEALLTYMRQSVQLVRFLAHGPNAKRVYAQLKAYHHRIGAKPDGPIDVSTDEYKRLCEDLDPLFKEFVEHCGAGTFGYDDVLVLCAAHGHVMYTAEKRKENGTNIRTGPYKDSKLRSLWEKVVKTGGPAVVDLSNYAPSGGPRMFAGAPLQTADGELAGVLVVEIGPERINSIMGGLKELGKTAKAYLVGSDMLMRSGLSLEGKSTILTKAVETDASRRAVKDETGTETIEDFRGKQVLSSYSGLGLRNERGVAIDFDWGIIAELDVDEAFALARATADRTILIGIVIAVGVTLLAYFLARGIARPIRTISGVAAEVSRGNLTVEVPNLKRSDEIGLLNEAFREMVGNLRRQIGQVLDSVNVVSKAASGISATVAQVVSGTTQTSSAVAETSTTAEQVKQAAGVARERARSVAESSQKAVEISTLGKRATEDTVERMNLIREQMASIGETVVRLSEHSQAIENIMGTVQDLADQSNLLAVNASIEAARAGDQGKGFAVVAHEIKTLADQSKEAAQQVRSILEDTRKWVSAVVMAAEQGGKAVDAGVEQSVAAGQAIEALAKSVMESSQAASVIQASSEQQSQGVDQVSGAIANIAQAVQQNLAGTSQLEEMAAALKHVGVSLEDLVQRYRV